MWPGAGRVTGGRRLAVGLVQFTIVDFLGLSVGVDVSSARMAIRSP
jgi:hypothetical protein